MRLSQVKNAQRRFSQIVHHAAWLRFWNELVCTGVPQREADARVRHRLRDRDGEVVGRLLPEEGVGERRRRGGHRAQLPGSLCRVFGGARQFLRAAPRWKAVFAVLSTAAAAAASSDARCVGQRRAAGREAGGRRLGEAGGPKIARAHS